MTRYEEITAALNAGAKVIVRLDTYRGIEDVSKFAAKFANNETSLDYCQIRFFFPGAKYRTNLLTPH